MLTDDMSPEISFELNDGVVSRPRVHPAGHMSTSRALETAPASFKNRFNVIFNSVMQFLGPKVVSIDSTLAIKSQPKRLNTNFSSIPRHRAKLTPP